MVVSAGRGALYAGAVAKDILYVEDDADHAELVLRRLERHALRERVLHVEDGELAMAFLASIGSEGVPPPRLVLLDLRLPRVDGIQVLDHIKSSESLQEIPVVVFTTSAADRDVKEAFAHHANSYVVKPDDALELDQVLGELTHYWLERNVACPA